MELLQCTRQCLSSGAAASNSRCGAATQRAGEGKPLTTPGSSSEAKSGSPPDVTRRPTSGLHEALQLHSVEKVQAALAVDTGAAAEPFWDHDVEPPLCCAVRLGCDVAIVRLLLESGATVDAADARGRTPLGILAAQLPPGGADCFNVLAESPAALSGAAAGSRSPAAEGGWRRRSARDVAQALMQAGADPVAADYAVHRPFDLAFANGNMHFMSTWLGCSEMDPTSDPSKEDTAEINDPVEQPDPRLPWLGCSEFDPTKDPLEECLAEIDGPVKGASLRFPWLDEPGSPPALTESSIAALEALSLSPPWVQHAW